MAAPRSAGFTPVEFLVAVVLIGVVFTAGIPLYRTAIEKVKKVEAIIMLGALRDSQLRYFTATSTYSGRIEALDFNPNDPLLGIEPHFSYEILAADAEAFYAAATRNTTDHGDGQGTVTIDQTGRIGGTL